MTEHKGLPVHGYRPQSQDAVDMVNANKQLEEKVLRRLEAITHSADARWLAIARTHFEEGFMALNRAVFRPGRVRLEDDLAQQKAEVEMHQNQVSRYQGHAP